MSLSASPLSASPDPTTFGGVYPAQVYSTADPLGNNRIQMWIPQIFGTQPVKIWAPPLLTNNNPNNPPPAVGALVWCIFQGGDPAYPTYLPQINPAWEPPPPITSGTAIHTTTDPSGQVWVAKGGLYGGSWNKAQDVIWMQASLSANYAVTAGWHLHYDSVASDTFGMWTLPGASPPYDWIYPINGRYQVTAGDYWGFGASGQWAQTYPGVSGNGIVGGSRAVTNTSGITADGSYVVGVVPAHAGNTGQIYYNGNAADHLTPSWVTCRWIGPNFPGS